VHDIDVVVPDALVALAHRVADAARAHSLPRFRAGIPVDDKRPQARFDPVTEADRAAEAAMRELLADQVPLHGILGEEHGETASDSDWRWILDPIDGTRAFISGFPTWVTLIGLLHQGQPAFGLIDAPATDDRWAGGAGHPSGGVRPCASLEQAVLSTTSAEMFRTPGEHAAWQALCARSRLRRYGGDGYAYGLLASGHIDAVIESGLQLYDVAAVIPVVRAAGGRVTGWDGGDALRGHVVASGDPRVHEQILEVLRVSGGAAAAVGRT